jgi:hypothetical protein
MKALTLLLAILALPLFAADELRDLDKIEAALGCKSTSTSQRFFSARAFDCSTASQALQSSSATRP